MIHTFKSILKPAPIVPLIQDKARIQGLYKYWRWRICYSLFFGYAIFYLTRKTFTYVMPYLAMDLGFTKAELGLLGSILYITYGISKFYSGAISDRSNPRYFMAIGLIMTGVCNIAFGLSSSFWLFALFWGLNGWFQAWGWPACCKSLTYWFNQQERGLWYSFCNTSHNVGGALIPIVTVFCALKFGWRWAMFIPAGISIVMGLILMNRLRDVPQSLGLPPVENKDHDHPIEQPALPRLSIPEIMFKHVLVNRFVWMFAIANFFVYFVRTAVCDWGVLYLMEARDFSDQLASSGPFWFEALGIAGMLIAGYVSDVYYKGNRVPIIIICGLGMCVSITGMWWVPNQQVFLDLFFFAMLGFFVFGPQMIVGLAASECVDKRAASSANGFAGTLGYLGAAAAGYPIGKSIDIFGWQGYYATMLVCSVLVFLLLIPFRADSRTYKPSTACF